MAKIGLHVRLDQKLVERLRADARRSSRSLDTVCSVVFEDFLRAWSAEERARFYETKSVKTAGRPVKSTIQSD